MSDTAPAPAELELISDGHGERCARYSIVIIVLLTINLIATIGFGLLGVHDRRTSTVPNPKPSHTATSTPTPSSSPSPPEPSGTSTPSPPSPSLSMPSDPTGTACSIWDPECDSGSITGGTSS
ncbi:hypothetical protein ACIQVL_03300 [Streptomyces sp. NPDC090499]|uniref:hypothetical protein n=1 Tax=Streptomyces sp. NPDC090499 TaxID=3365965 RepID=UPI003821EDA7